MSADHYVAQTYLQNFINSNGKLIPYYKNGRVIIGKTKSPKEICFETDGDSNPYFENTRVLDEYLPHIENSWADSVADLAAGKFSGNCKYKISEYIAFLRSCNPTAKRLGAKSISAKIQPIIDKTLADNLHIFGETTDEIRTAIETAINGSEIIAIVDEAYAHKLGIQNLIQIANIVYCSHWTVLVNETGIPFLASDNPASLYYPEGNSQEAMIFVPLSPKLGVLSLKDKSISKPTSDDVKNYNRSGDRYMHPKEEFVKILNELTVRNAEKIVLHSLEEKWVAQLVENNKEWRVESKTFSIQNRNRKITYSQQRVCKNN